MPYFIKDNFGGGAEVQAYLKAKYAAIWGYDVYYLTSNPGGKPIEENVENIKVIRKLKMPFPIRNTWKIFKEILRIKPDIVYTRMNWPALLPIGLASKIVGAKTLWFATEDAQIERWFHTKIFFKNASKYPKHKIRLVPLYLNSFLEDIFFQAGIYLFAKHYVQNEVQKYKLKESFGINSEIFKSIHEIPENTIKKSEKPLVIWVANMGRRKRPELFFEVVKKLPNIGFIIAGSIKKEYSWIVEKKLPNLKVLGKIPFGESERLFEKAWIYVNTSESQREGFPNTFIQAWKYRTLVVSAEVDPDNLLSERGLGILTGSSPEKIAEAIEDAVKNMSKYEGILDRARKYVEENHSPENWRELLQNI